MLYYVVTVCGSMRFFYPHMLRAAEDLSMRGYIVLMPFVTFAAAGQDSEEKDALDMMHLRKIDLSDEIYVVNIDGYIGKSTAREIEYARLHDKTVIYHETVR
jgi:hypothetical protein